MCRCINSGSPELSYQSKHTNDKKSNTYNQRNCLQSHNHGAAKDNNQPQHNQYSTGMLSANRTTRAQDMGESPLRLLLALFVNERLAATGAIMAVHEVPANAQYGLSEVVRQRDGGPLGT